MKKIQLAVMLIAVSAFTISPLTSKATGNGAPSGAHYNLNILGVSNPKTADMTGDQGGRIFVNLSGKSTIYLQEGATFQVLDANGTDGNGAKFQLPKSDPDNDGITEYSVFVRALGKPGGNARLSTCAQLFDETTGTYTDYCPTTQLELSRGKGKSSFTNVSRDLLYVTVDLDGDGIAERYPLFSEALQNYFWQYDNNGLKHVQLRFYEIPTNVN